jgi:hypothetical protein
MRPTIHVLTDRNGNGIQDVGPPADPSKDGWWDKVDPFYGAPTQQRIPANNCVYDPNDDGDSENDISDASPTFVFSTAGTVFGPSSTCFPEFVYGCAGDTQDPPYDPNQGQVVPSPNCFPEVLANGAPVVREGNGPGRWIETKVDLYPYRGRQDLVPLPHLHGPVRIRYLDHGLRRSLRRQPRRRLVHRRHQGHRHQHVALHLKADTDAPPASSCPNPSTCLPITARVSGSTYPTRSDNVDNDGDSTTDESDEGGFTTVLSDAPLRNVLLNGQDLANPTTTAGCLNGVLQYRFSIDGNSTGHRSRRGLP